MLYEHTGDGSLCVVSPMMEHTGDGSFCVVSPSQAAGNANITRGARIESMEWPDEFVIIERIEKLKEPFLYEFLLDAEDIILDFKYENEKANAGIALS